MKPLDFHPDAVVEADEAFDWYADSDIHVALEFKAMLNELLDRVCLMPAGFPRYI